MLDENLIFSNVELKKTDYASKRLKYPLEECPTPGWDKLMSILYSPEERHKIEWAIGSIVTGDSKELQMFKGWMGNYYKCLSRQQREGIVGLYETLFHKKVYVKNKKLIIVSV